MSDLTERVVGRMLGERNQVRLGAFAILLVLLFSIASKNFLTLLNFQSMGFQVAEVGLLSLAVMLSMLSFRLQILPHLWQQSCSRVRMPLPQRGARRWP
jgi:hypothetical protein